MTIFARLGLWLCRNEPVRVPPSRLDALLAEWSREAKRGGPGSDIAAARAYGAKTAILSLGVQARAVDAAQADILNRAIGWRGGR